MKKLIPYILIIIRSIIFGSTVLFTRQLLQGAFVFDVLATRFLLTAFFFILLKLTGIIHVSFRGKDMRFPMLTALCEPGCYFIFETFGIMGTTTVLAGILLAMSSAVIIILETVFLKEKTTILQKLCLLIRILGGIVVVAFGVNSGKNTAWGIGAIILAMVSGAGYAVATRKSSQQFSAIETTFFTSIFGAVLFNGINVIIHITSGTLNNYFDLLLNPQNWGGLIFLSLISSIAATVMTNYCYSKIQASLVSALSGISTVVTIAVGVIFNHEKLYPYHIIGTVMILGGALCMNLIPYFQHKHETEREKL